MSSEAIASLSTAKGGAADGSLVNDKAIRVLAVALIVLGVVARLSPLIDFDSRLFYQYMTEDGYLMQTIARNMAIGLGMTTAEGTIATNGIQPLATFFFTALHYVAGGSKLGGIVLVTIFSAVFASVAAYFYYRSAALVLRPLAYGRQLALIASALWFAAPLIVPISMNGLETSFYWMSLLGTLFYYLSTISTGASHLQWSQRLLLGLLLGLTFLSRNDAVFFIAVLLGLHLLFGGGNTLAVDARRFVDCCVAGVTSIVIASPWLYYNYQLFGSVVPISGTAQSYSTAAGSNLALIPGKLFEATTLFLPLPGSLERSVVTIILGVVALLVVLGGFWILLAKRDTLARRFGFIGLGLVLCLSGYYGIAFGAPHFLARYLSILSPFLWLAAIVTLFGLLEMVFAQSRRLALAATTVIAGLCVIAVAIIALTLNRGYSQGTAHMHKQVVDWVTKNVPESTWVGAPQTGTVGYFHDRTLNLDGKVNPGALRALLKEGHILSYVLDSKVDYIADWAGMADWVNLTHLNAKFPQEFTVVVRDDAANLAVLKRVHPRSE